MTFADPFDTTTPEPAKPAKSRLSAEAFLDSPPAKPGEAGFVPPTQSAEDFLGPAEYSDRSRLAGSAWDRFFSLPNYAAYNKAYGEAFGPDPLGLDRMHLSAPPAPGEKDTRRSITQILRDEGLFVPSQGRGSWLQMMNESLFRGTIAAIDWGMRGTYATLRGMAAEGQGIPEPGEAARGPISPGAVVGQVGSALFEAFPAGHATAFPTRPRVGALNPFHPDIVNDTIELAHKDPAEWTANRAVQEFNADQGTPNRPNRIVLEASPDAPKGEDIYRSGLERERAAKVEELNKLDPVTQKAARDQIQRELADLHKSITELPAPDTAVSSTPVAPPASVELELLREQRAELSRWLKDMQTEPRTFDIAGVELPASTRLMDADRALVEAEQRQTGEQATTAGQVQQVTEALADVDRRITELTPQVAEERQGPPIKYEFQPPRYEDVGLPPEGETPLPDGVTRNPIDPNAPAIDPGLTVDTPNGMIFAKDVTEARQVAAKYGVLSQRRATIAQEVYRDLVAAGRPDREARANAAIIQAYYETKAARFDGALGTAREIYDAEAPEIKAGRGRNRGAYYIADNTIKLFQDADASTFMHESAHNFLEQMLVDVTHEHAPASLIEDVQAIKDWLKMEGDRPTRAQHELFARGFERYLMEGVAPSQKLAGAFAKLQAWLSKLYQTVAALKAPITNDIRAVYDRMLSQPKTEAFIEPTRPGKAGFADAHEAAVRETPPGMEHAEAERIRAERDDIGSVLRTEIDAGIRRARALGRVAATTDEGVAGGATVPAKPSRRVPARTERAGAGEAAAEVGAGGATAEVERVTSPDQPIGGAGGGTSRYIDKDGSFLHENIRTPEDVEHALRESAAYNKNFGHEANATVSDGQLLDLANSLGADVSFLDRKLIGESFNAAEITAARLLIRQNEAEILAAAKKAREGGGATDLATALARNSMIQGKLNQARAEWGRAGRALQEISAATTDEALAAFLKDNKGDFGRNYDQLMQMAHYMGTLGGQGLASKFSRNTIGARFPMLYYYLNSLLSGPITHSIYAIGNELRAVSQPLIITPMQAAVGEVRAIGARLAGREVPTDRVHWREIAADWYGFGKGQIEGWRAMKAAFNSGSQVTLPGLQGYASAMSQIGNTIDMPMGTGFRRMATGIGTGDLREGWRGAVQLYGLPYRSVAAIHSFGAVVRYSQNISRYATRQALSEGLSGNALETRIAKLRADPTDAMMQQAFNDKGGIMPDVPKELQDWAEVAQRASQEAMNSMYMRVYDYHSAAATTIRGLHSNGFTAMMVPFVKVGLEIQRENVRHTPLAYLGPEMRGQLLGRAGGAALDEAQGRLLFGMSLMAGGAFLAANGWIDDIGPHDPAERAVWKLNHTEHSIHIGSVRVPMKGIPVLGSLLMFGADMYAASHDNWWKPGYEQLAKNVLHGIASAALDEGVFISLGDIGEVVQDPVKHASKWLLNWVPNFMPWSIGMSQVNRFGIDPYSKDIHGFDPTAVLDSFRSKIPGQSEYVPNRVDVYGNPIASRGSWIAHYNDYENDPVTRMLNSVHMSIGNLPRNIEGVDLTTREYEHYATLAGRGTYNMLQQFTKSDLSKISPNIRRVMFEHTVEAARAAARGQMLAESQRNDPQNSLTKRIYEKKMELFKQ